MGYTHYWNHAEIDALAWSVLAKDVRRIVKASPVTLAGWHGTGNPVVDSKRIALNGSLASNEHCESFVLGKRATRFDFCKTGREPYDVIVCTILLRADWCLTDFHFRSDGKWDDEDWQPGRDLYASVFGESYVGPGFSE